MRNTSRIGVLSLLALGLLLSSAAAADKPKELIIGKWTPTEEKAKDKFFLEFTKDGKLIISAVEGEKTKELAKGTYKFTGDDQIETDMEFMGEKKKETLTIKVTKDKLTTIDDKKKEDAFTRVK